MARPRSGRKTDIKQVIKMRNAGASLQTIAETQGVSKQAIHLMLKDVASMIAPPEELEKYRAQQADVMDSIGMAYGSRLLDEDAIKGASALQAATVLAIATDKARLIRGETTSNHLVIHASAALKSAEDWGNGHVIDASPCND